MQIPMPAIQAALSGFSDRPQELVEAGYDLIDLNFGCPVKRVLGRGGFLLSEPATALFIVTAVVESVGGRRSGGLEESCSP